MNLHKIKRRQMRLGAGWKWVVLTKKLRLEFVPAGSQRLPFSKAIRIQWKPWPRGLNKPRGVR